MKIRREEDVPPEKGRRLTKGNRQLVAGDRPGTVGEESGHVQKTTTTAAQRVRRP